jgi:hypothetical protein
VGWVPTDQFLPHCSRQIIWQSAKIQLKEMKSEEERILKSYREVGVIFNQHRDDTPQIIRSSDRICG